MTAIKDTLRALISEAKTDKAIQLLLDYSNGKDWKNDAIQQLDQQIEKIEKNYPNWVLMTVTG